jgi:hypothetical protein
METLLIPGALLAIVIALDLAALRWGVDSTDGRDWREHR